MYTITAPGLPTFRSDDRLAAGKVFRQYRKLYAWDKQSVRVRVKRVRV